MNKSLLDGKTVDGAIDADPSLVNITPERIRPFYCGTQGAEWRSQCENCHRAGHHVDNDQRKPWVKRCDIQEALDEAYWDDGFISAEIAKRMGYDGNIYGPGQCGEIDPIYPLERWYAHNAASPKVLLPLHKRLRRTWKAAWSFYNPWWEPEVDIYGEMGRISFRLAWSIAWGVHRDDETVKPWLGAPITRRAGTAMSVNLIASGPGLYEMANGKKARVDCVSVKPGEGRAIGEACVGTANACAYLWWLDGRAGTKHERFNLVRKIDAHPGKGKR